MRNRAARPVPVAPMAERLLSLQHGQDPHSRAGHYPIETIAPNVSGLRVLIVNVYAVSRSPNEWVLVDCRLPYSHGRIKHWVEEQFGAGARPTSILLTHGHFDHTGSVEELAGEWDVPVYVHPLEVPYVTGKSEYPPPDPAVGGGLMALMAKLYPRGPANLGRRVQLLPVDGSVPGLPGWRWIHTPGHTAGHISLFRDEDRVLVAGDAFVTTKQESFLAVATQRPELHGPPAYYTTGLGCGSQFGRAPRRAFVRPSSRPGMGSRWPVLLSRTRYPTWRPTSTVSHAHPTAAMSTSPRHNRPHAAASA